MYHARAPPPYRQSTLDLHSWLSSVTTLDTLDAMSAKGYSAVPTNEPRESVDTESRAAMDDDEPRQQLVDEPDEAEPTASDRLLPFGDDASPAKAPLNKRATRWIRSRPARIAASCRAFKKRHSARSIILAFLIAFLLASTTGLAISTGILACRPRYCNSHYTDRVTRIPWTWNLSGREVYYRAPWLELPVLYPPLAQDAEFSCKMAWAELPGVACHEKILNRAWDDGKQRSLFEPRYDLYASNLAESKCLRTLESAHALLASQCTTKDLFDASEYVGPMVADPQLEPGPVEAVATLVKRARHTARQRPKTGFYDRTYDITCAAELYQDWFIIDGMNSANLHGLDVFVKATTRRENQENQAFDWRSFPSDRCDGGYPAHRRHGANLPKKGPNDGDTQCSWCLMDWFDRKLQSWEEGKVVYGFNGTTVSLPTFLRTIEHAGRRCQSHDWERIFRKSIWMYRERGFLPDDWDDEDGSTAREAFGRAGKTFRLDKDRRADLESPEVVVEQIWTAKEA